MLTIHKLRADPVIDFAAQELKKYLRMMMPRGGDISIVFDPAAREGFRLGLLQDHGLVNEAPDPVLDDIIHVDIGADGGILAGSNPRSVLFAVYRMLKLNGCRWLYPGVDGEHIPIAQLAPTKYHKMADHRFRGHCNEGAENQQCMLETIDFYAKLELNVYMLEFDIPYVYYDYYYSHLLNSENRPPEPVSPDQVLQWKRQCEVEIARRGLQFHDMGHGWTAEPFGISSTAGWGAEHPVLTGQQLRCLAQIDGVRGLNKGVALNTNVCMSDPQVRARMATAIADYAQAAQNVDYLHVWLADGKRAHCECPECQKARPSDFYMQLMNELDALLTARGLATRIVFIAYYDTLFAPERVTVQNPARFSLLYAPITRSYSQSIRKDAPIPPPQTYVRNRWKKPVSAEENLAFLRAWQQVWKGPAFSYEYHFWRHQYHDPGMLALSRRIYEDICALRPMGLDGYVEDGSQRSFFPNGFAMYIYAEALMDAGCSYDAVLADYFSHIYGDFWPQVHGYLQKVSDAFDFAYMSGECSQDRERGKYYAPQRADRLRAVATLATQIRELAAGHFKMPTRPQTVSMRLLYRHAEYVQGVAAFMAEKAVGVDDRARELARAFFADFGKYEVELERYFDHYLCAWSFQMMLK